MGYNGLYLIGGKQDYTGYKLTNFGWDYAYDAERDMIDAGPVGNFGRFINHQDEPSIEAQSVVIDKQLAVEKGIIEAGEMEKIKDVEFLEIMALYTIEDIYPGQELFGDYGEGYWAEKQHLKARQASFHMHSKVLNSHAKTQEKLKNEVDTLQRRVKFLEEKYTHLRNIL